MSLVVLSSAQDKYQSVGNLASSNGQVLPSSVMAPGIQNPNQFTNNINPVMTIPANSEVALKDISFYKSAAVKVGINVNMAVWIGELLRSRWGVASNLEMRETVSTPIRIPLQPGSYTPSTFCVMLENMLNQYISYPDLFGNISVVPWSTRNDGENKTGYIFNFDRGLIGGALVDRSADMSNVYACPPSKNNFTWNQGTKTYGASAHLFKDNIGVFTNMPLSLNGGNMTWDVSSCTSGWRISLTRPITPRFAKPRYFSSGPQLNQADSGYADIILEYAMRTDNGYTDAENTFRIFHTVYDSSTGNPNRQYFKEVEYYKNNKTHFTPDLDSYWVPGVNPAPGVGEDHLPMYRDTPTTLTDLGTAPLTVSITVSGEDTTVKLTRAATLTPWDDPEIFVMTDSRLCIKGNATLGARTPTKNRFIKPIGTSCQALYPKISLDTSGEFATLTTFNGINTDDYQYPLDKDAGVGGGGAGPHFPASPTGADTTGSSYYGRSRVGVQRSQIYTQIIECDRAKPYNMGIPPATAHQKQYVGLDGPTGNNPPVRIGEGSPFIPATAVGTGSQAYVIGLITMPSADDFDVIDESGLTVFTGPKGVYMIDEVSDVSDLLGFANTSFVGQTLMGQSYLYADRPTQATSAPPTNTPGAFFGWYVGSTSVPKYSDSSAVFVRCPTLTHQSYNFGKGIPSKIISTIPKSVIDSSTSYGEGFFAPNELTYLTLNNTETLNFNDLSIELVDKNERILDVFERNTTITLHFRKAK